MELFFDLVYVFAVTQVSGYLGHHLSVRGALETLVLFVAVWWAWNYTTWATNWVDPQRAPVALMMLCLMVLSLLMADAIPSAFAAKGLLFAGSYVALQVLRSAFMVLAFQGQTMGRNYAQLLSWSAIAGVGWIVGAVLHGDARLVVWIAALLVDLAAPIHGFWLPGLGDTPMEDWSLAGAHLAERMQLVLMIALGESILRVGATFAETPTTAATVAAFLAGFAGTAALWAVYFLRHAGAAASAIASARDAARVGRAGYAYAHALMVGGTIVLAVAIELTIAHPSAPLSTADAAVMLAGPTIFLAGNALFLHSVTGSAARIPLGGIAAIALLGPVALADNRLALGGAATIVLLILAGLVLRAPQQRHRRASR
jgi:low temperature requirement protein LtrA